MEINKRIKLFNEVGFDRNYLKFIIILMISLGALFFGSKNFIIFNSIVQVFCLFIGIVVMVISCYSYLISNQGRFLYLGISLMFINIFYFLHILTLQQGNGLHWGNINISFQLSLIVKYLDGFLLLTMFAVPLEYFVNKKNYNSIIFFNIVLSVFIIFSVLVWRNFPQCYNVHTGPTMFKLVSEYIISFMMILTLAFINAYKNVLPKKVFWGIVLFVCTKIASQILFTISYELSSIFNVLGHILRFWSFYIIHKIILDASFKNPLNFLFGTIEERNKELEKKSIELQKTNLQLKNEIEEVQKIQQLLILSEEKYKRLVEFIPDAVLVHSENKILFTNQAGLNLMGFDNMDKLYTAEVSHMMHFLKRDHQRRILDISSSQKWPYRFEEIIHRKDGANLHIEVITTPYLCDEEEVFLSVIRDITHRKQVETLKKSMDENYRLLKEAVEMDKVKTDYFTNVSHELRTPLSIMLCSLQIMEGGLNDNSSLFSDKEKMKKYITSMKQNSFKLLKNVNNILDVSKFEAGFLDLKLKNHDIVNIVETVTSHVWEYTNKRGIILMFDTEIEEKVIACDIDKIERIMLNLISNAIKFTKKGGLIEVNIKDLVQTVLITVKDTGVGISEDQIQYVFERFKQADNSFTRKNEGTGIGLSLVKSMVQMHGGNIKVESQVGVGTTFYIELPVRTTEEDTENLSIDFERNIKDDMNVEFSDIV